MSQLSPLEAEVVQAFLGGYLETQDRVALDKMRELTAEKFPKLPIDGKGLSVLLRRLGFNRDYDAPAKSGIVYKRSGAAA